MAHPSDWSDNDEHYYEKLIIVPGKRRLHNVTEDEKELIHEVHKYAKIVPYITDTAQKEDVNKMLEELNNLTTTFQDFQNTAETLNAKTYPDDFLQNAKLMDTYFHKTFADKIEDLSRSVKKGSQKMIALCQRITKQVAEIQTRIEKLKEAKEICEKRDITTVTTRIQTKDTKYMEYLEKI